MDAVLERRQEVPAAAQDLRLEAGLAVERDEARLDRALRDSELLDDADAVVRDVAEEERGRQSAQEEDEAHEGEEDG